MFIDPAEFFTGYLTFYLTIFFYNCCMSSPFFLFWKGRDAKRVKKPNLS